MRKKIFQYIPILFLFPLFIFSQNKKIDSLKTILKISKNDTTRLIILNNIAIDLETKEPDSSIIYYKKVQVLAQKIILSFSIKSKEYRLALSSLSDAFFGLGIIYDDKGDCKYAIQLYNRSMEIKQKIDDKIGLSKVFYNIGGLYISQNKIITGIDYLNKSLKIKEEISDKMGIARITNYIGTVYSDQGNIFKALEFYNKSLKIAEEIGDKESISNCLLNIAIVYQNQNEHNLALLYYQKSFNIYSEIKNKEGEALVLSNFASIYTDKKDYLKALDYFNKSLKIYEGLNNIENTAFCIGGIGYVFKEQKNLIKALEYFKRSLKISQEIDDKNEISRALYFIGEVYIEIKKYDTALQYVMESMKISKELGFSENIKRAAFLLNKIYKKQGNYNNALINYELFIQMRDSLNNIETQKATIRQQTQYEFDKQQAIQKEKHDAEIKLQDEKSLADKKKQNIILLSVSFVLLIVALFSFLLFKRFKTTQHQKIIIEKKEKETQQQKHLVEEKQKEILDSINYAKRLQEAILPPLNYINEHLPNNFVLYQPKDVVAGDFYWAEMKEDKFFIAAADCTGHGVPGAMVSVVCSNALNRTVNEFGITNTGNILDKTRELVLETFAKGNSEVKDGMDISLLCIDKKNNKAFWSGANNPLWYIDSVTSSTQPSVTSSEVEKSTATGLDSAQPEIKEIKADKQPIGKTENPKPFTTHEIELKPGIQFYLFTDGYADQFGGPKGKKFKYKQLEEFLLENANKTMQEQHQTLLSKFSEWKGDLEQVDDVCVIGLLI